MTNAERWAANKKFLDRTIKRGDLIVLATKPRHIKPNSWYEKEIKYLRKKVFVFHSQIDSNKIHT
jgi:hypothetical protein